MRVAGVDVLPVWFELRRSFATSRRATSVARNVWVRVRLDGGMVGFGEASPTPYVTGEDQESVVTALRGAAQAFQGLDAREHAAWGRLADNRLSGAPTAQSALEMALFDALARSQGVSLARWFGGALPEVVSDLTLSLGSVEDAGTAAAEAAGDGFSRLKVKIGHDDPEHDLSRLERIHSAAPAALLRLDANQAFSADSALRFLEQCVRRGLPLELVEQPVPARDLDALAAVTAASPVPVIADEAVCCPAEVLKVATARAAHGINIKLAKFGLRGALDAIAIARAAGLKLMLGCMLESVLGIGAAVHLAAGTGAFDFLDLDGHLLIGQAVGCAAGPFSQQGESLRPGADAGGMNWDYWPGESADPGWGVRLQSPE